MPLFISFGNEIVIVVILMGLLWVVFICVQIGTGGLAIRAAVRGQLLRAVIWAVICFALVGAEPLYRWNDLRQAEAAMARAAIQRDLPDFTGASVLYVPTRDLDDVSLSCQDLVQLSGADTVYLADPWFDNSSGDGVPVPDPNAPIDLLARIKGTAAIETRDYGDACVLRPGPAPERLDYLLFESRHRTVEAAFADHLNAHAPGEDYVLLDFLIAPVPDARAFQLSPETALLALFSTTRVKPSFPFNPLRSRLLYAVPMDAARFQSPVRQVVCHEAFDAPEQICWPFR